MGVVITNFQIFKKNYHGSGGIWTHASEETGALNQRLRPLGHATLLIIERETNVQIFLFVVDPFIHVFWSISMFTSFY